MKERGRKRKTPLSCSNVQRLITKFINNQLTLKDTEIFLNHVSGCSECMEELEVYYILFTGMKLLDEKNIIGNDFHREFEVTLKKAHDRVLNEKLRRIRNRILFLLLVILLAFLLG